MAAVWLLLQKTPLICKVSFLLKALRKVALLKPPLTFSTSAKLLLMLAARRGAGLGSLTRWILRLLAALLALIRLIQTALSLA